LLRNASKFVNYNFREHAKRRIIGEFHNNKGLVTVDAEAKFVWGINQAEVVRRQALISQLYPEEQSVAAGRSKTSAH
jgi:hypothetical protein